MDIKDFTYTLPRELIAQNPLENRASSRLMFLGRESGEIRHGQFQDIKACLQKGDCLVINDTKVIPARLFGIREDSGAKIELLLLKRLSEDVWESLVKPGKKMQNRRQIILRRWNIEGGGFGGDRGRQPLYSLFV